MTRPSGSVAALAFLTVAAAAQTPPPLEGHWQCMDIVTNGGTTDYYEFDFGSTGELTLGFKTSGAIFTGRGTWTIDPADDALIHLSSHGEKCNKYGFRCGDYDSRINFAFVLLSSSAVDFRTNGVVVRCQAASGQIDVDNWQPSTAQKAISILNMFGKGLEAAGNAGMRYEQMRNGNMGSTTAGGASGDDAAPGGAADFESADNDKDAAEAQHSEAAKQRRINYLNWFITDNERKLARWEKDVQDKEAQNDKWAREGHTAMMTSPHIISSLRNNNNRLQQMIDKAKAELARLQH